MRPARFQPIEHLTNAQVRPRELTIADKPHIIEGAYMIVIETFKHVSLCKFCTCTSPEPDIVCNDEIAYL